MDQVLTVPAGNIAGMIFSLIVAGGLPIGLCIVIHKRFRAGISAFFIGGGTFFLFAMILEQFSHVLFLYQLGSFSEMIRENIWLYGLYGGLAAGLFEETGRFLAMKFVMNKRLNREQALMYGAGHGGIEAILILGITSVNNLVIAVMINLGIFEQTLMAVADPQAMQAAIAPLATTPAWQFFVGGIERIMAVVLQIALSVLVYTAVKTKSRWYWFPLAILIHFLVDFIAVVAAGQGALIAAEGLMLIGTIVVSAIAYRLWQGEQS